MNVPAPKHPVGIESAGIVVLDADDRVLVVHRPLQNDKDKYKRRNHENAFNSAPETYRGTQK